MSTLKTCVKHKLNSSRAFRSLQYTLLTSMRSHVGMLIGPPAEFPGSQSMNIIAAERKQDK